MNAWNENLLTEIHSERNSELRDAEIEKYLEEIELLREQVQSWYQLMANLNQELNETQQELAHTNQELCSAYKSNKIELKQAIELAQTILQQRKPVCESLAELLSAIYDLSITATELVPITANFLDSIQANRFKTDSERLQTEYIQVKDRYDNWGNRFIGFKARLTNLKKVQRKEFIKENFPDNRAKSKALTTSDSCNNNNLKSTSCHCSDLQYIESSQRRLEKTQKQLAQSKDSLQKIKSRLDAVRIVY